jgi:hypothetical protein
MFCAWRNNSNTCIALLHLEKCRAEEPIPVDITTIRRLHGTLQSRPGEDVTDRTPKALKGVTLKKHQRVALAWLKWREQHEPHGGILGTFFICLLYFIQ